MAINRLETFLEYDLFQRRERGLIEIAIIRTKENPYSMVDHHFLLARLLGVWNKALSDSYAAYIEKQPDIYCWSIFPSDIDDVGNIDIPDRGVVKNCGAN